MGIWLQDSSFLSEIAVNHLKKARGENWPKHSERRNNTKNYQDEDKKSSIYIYKKKKINSQIKKPYLKMIPIKCNIYVIIFCIGCLYCINIILHICYCNLCWYDMSCNDDIKVHYNIIYIWYNTPYYFPSWLGL